MENKDDVKIFWALCLWTLMPAVYQLFRMNIVSVNQVNIDILGQMEWFDLIDEIITTAFVVPLYYLLKDRDSGKNGFSFALSFGAYAVFTIIFSVYIGNISAFMKAEFAKEYLLMQSVSLLIAFVGVFANLIFMIYRQYRFIVLLMVTRLLVLCLADAALIPIFKDLGASCSEIIANTVVALLSMGFILKKNYVSFAMGGRDFLRAWAKIGAFSGLQIFLDNFNLYGYRMPHGKRGFGVRELLGGK